MLLFTLLVLLVIISTVSILITQVIIPKYNNRPIFPYFRRERELYHSIEALEQMKHEQELEEIISTAADEINTTTKTKEIK